MIDRVCELVHIDSAICLIISCCWGFKGPISGADGTRYFEPGGVFFWGDRIEKKPPLWLRAATASTQ